MIRRARKGKWQVGALNLFAIGSLSFDQAQELLTALPPRSILGPRVPTTELWMLSESTPLNLRITKFVRHPIMLVVQPEPIVCKDGSELWYMTVGSVLWAGAREYRNQAVLGTSGLHELDVTGFILKKDVVELEVAT